MTKICLLPISYSYLFDNIISKQTVQLDMRNIVFSEYCREHNILSAKYYAKGRNYALEFEDESSMLAYAMKFL